MNPRIPLLAAALLAAAPALAGTALSDSHPEDAYRNDAPPVVSADPYAELIRQVQQKLHALDFDPGPVNGAISTKTQAALAQFQLSELLPASGALDQPTLLALGIDPAQLVSSPEEAPAAGATAGEDAFSSGNAEAGGTAETK